MANAKKDPFDEKQPTIDDLIDIEGFAEETEEFAEPEIDEMEAIRLERDDMRDRFMRALADAENSRKRGERDRREADERTIEIDGST